MRRPAWVFVLAAAVLFAVLAMPLRSSIVDDTYIHLQYARNLAEAGELSFNRGDPTYGATSPLWVLILSAVHRLGGDLVFFCRVLSWASAVAVIVLVYALAARIAGRGTAAVAAALIMAADAWFLRWTAVGMETSFAALTVLAALTASFSAMRSYARSFVFGLLLLFAVLSRPEAMLLVPLALFVFMTAGGGRPGIRLAWLLLFVVCFAAWLIVVRNHTGTYLPLTAGAKQGRPVLSLALLGRALIPVKIMGVTLVLPWVSLILSLVIGLVRYRSLVSCFAGRPGKGGRDAADLRAGILLAVLWAFALPVVYVLFDFQVLSRYLVPVSPVIVVLGVAGAARLAGRFTGRPGIQKIALSSFAAVVVIQNVIFYAVVVVPPTREFSQGVRDVLVPMGEWLQASTDESAVVAVPDIGAIGYTSRRRVLDLGGLVTPEINRMRRTIDVERIIEEGLYLDFRPDFLIDRSTEPARFDGRIIRDVRFFALMRGTVANLGIRQPDPVVYVLYRLEREGSAGGGGG
jgi:hypothetical protein